MFDKRSAREAAPIVAETVLSNQIKLEGRLQSTSNIRFDGEMNGDLTTEGDLSVGEHGRVKGNVSGRNVVVGSLIIDEGGILRGKSAVHAEESAASTVSVGVRQEVGAAA